jgi:hypothetical protein
MAYDEGVAQRLRECFEDRSDIVEKKMFGGIAFMVSGNMCCGVVDDILMARVGPDQYQQALTMPHAREMDFTGKPLRGFVYVEPEGFSDDEALFSWVEHCLSFVNTLPAK